MGRDRVDLGRVGLQAAVRPALRHRRSGRHPAARADSAGTTTPAAVCSIAESTSTWSLPAPYREPSNARAPGAGGPASRRGPAPRRHPEEALRVERRRVQRATEGDQPRDGVRSLKPAQVGPLGPALVAEDPPPGIGIGRLGSTRAAGLDPGYAGIQVAVVNREASDRIGVPGRAAVDPGALVEAVDVAARQRRLLPRRGVEVPVMDDQGVDHDRLGMVDRGRSSAAQSPHRARRTGSGRARGCRTPRHAGTQG